MNATRRALLASLLIALTVAGGYALAGVPNIEVVTLLAFTSGYLLGPRLGALVGGVAMGAHSLFNVMGAAIPPVLAAQVVCYALVGAAGGVVGPLIVRLGGVVSALAAGATGAVLVIVYQVTVGVVSFYTFTSESMLWAYLWGGVAFATVQIVWNAALFLVTLRPMLSVLRRYRAELRERWDS
jgi:hypothetical protein